jgi:hypothetical protein
VKARRQYVKPGHCHNCGGPCDLPSVDNTGQDYLGCRSCRIVLAAPPCGHKFVDSKRCLLCGWLPTPRSTPVH